MTKKRKSIKQVDRAAQYIDSPLMTQRLRYGRDLSARIDGNYGVYRTRVRLGRLADGNCSCPSEGWPCKHVRALEATWKSNPASFFDLTQVLEDLANKSRVDLLKLIAKMAMVAPDSLGACGVTAFNADEAEHDFD
jgi:hypothetical protein